MPANRKGETPLVSPTPFRFCRELARSNSLRTGRAKSRAERGSRNSEAEASHKRAARSVALPYHAQALAVERLLERIRRHGVSSLGERRIVNFLVAAQMIALAQAARFDAGEVARRHLHASVVVTFADFESDRGRLDAHHVGEQAAARGLRERLERRALLAIGAPIHDQNSPGRIRIVEPVPERRVRLDDGHQPQPVQTHAVPTAVSYLPGKNGLLALQIDFRVSET